MPPSREWIRRYMDMAHLVASWSKDPSTKMGAVIVRPNKTVASVGFNGFPRGIDDSEHRLNNREEKYPRIVHAELNAILNCMERPEGYDMFVTPFTPCSACAAAIIQSGIAAVYTIAQTPDRWKDSFVLGAQMLQEAKVQYVVLDWYIQP